MITSSVPARIVGGFGFGEIRRLCWWVVVAGLLVGLATAPAAQADLRRGSAHRPLVGTGKKARLAMPLPVVTQVPTLTRISGGRIRVVTKVDYVAANWKGSRGVARDRASVTVHVARRLLSTGPDPSAPRFRKPHAGLLSSRRAHRTYTVTLPAKIARYLKARGVFAAGATRRARARRLVWVDVEQDRDFQGVDGRYDWREGTAWNAADRLRARPKRGTAFTGSVKAHAADASQPSGTLTVQNATAWGIYPPNTYAYNASTGYPWAPVATLNNAGAPLLIAGSAVQCFDSGTSGSNPNGFTYADASGAAQPYPPGATLQNTTAGASAPQSTGFAVTEPITADDSLARASNNEVADVSGYLDGALNLAFAAASVFAGGPSGFYGGANIGYLLTTLLDVDTIPSPGTVVSALVDIALAVYGSSCSGNPNLLALAVTEPGGATVTDNLSVSEEGIYPYTATDCTTSAGASTPCTASNPQVYGEQVSPSINSYDGLPLFLHGFIQGSGVSPNAIAGAGNAYIGYDWTNTNYCTAQSASLGGATCTATPAPSPVVSSTTGPVDCGTGNLACPAPAAGFPAGTTLPASTNTNAPTATTVSGTSTSVSGCATNVPASTAQYGAGSAVFSPNGAYELSMTSGGVLELLSAAGTGAVLWTAPTIAQNLPATSFSNGTSTPGSYFTMQTDGNLVLYAPGGASDVFNTGTDGNSGAYLAVQNDGNLVLYTAGNSPLWATGTLEAASCPPPTSAAQTVSFSCATMIPASSSDYPAGTTFNSPNGDYQLIMTSGGTLQLSDELTSKPLWESRNPTQPAPATSVGQQAYDSTFSMQNSGNLVVQDTEGVYVFQTNTAGNSGAFLAVQNDGNLVLYSSTLTPLWATSTIPLGVPACTSPTFTTAS